MSVGLQNLREVLSFLAPPGATQNVRATSNNGSPRETQNRTTARTAIQDTLEISLEAEATLALTEAANSDPPIDEQATSIIDVAAEATDGNSNTDAPIPSADAQDQSGSPTDTAVDEATDAEPTSETEEELAVGELTSEEQEVVDQLEDRDREVRTHEQAHLAVAGQYARGGATYTYQRGPDGQQYAVGGEVSIDTAPVSGDPEATIRKAQTVRAAALAPAEPSSQDRRVAAAATQLEIQARQELREQQDGGDEVAEDSTESELIESTTQATTGILLDLVG